MTAVRRRLATLATSALLACLPALAQAQRASSPSRPVRLIVPTAAGTGPDIVARMVAQKLSEGWGGVGVVVDNKPGAGGLISATEAARAAPDGYTLLLGELGLMSIAPSSYSKLPYDPVKDFAPVSHIVSADLALLVNPQKVPARNVKDFVEWVRQQPGLFMATFGTSAPLCSARPSSSSPSRCTTRPRPTRWAACSVAMCRRCLQALAWPHPT